MSPRSLSRDEEERDAFKTPPAPRAPGEPDRGLEEELVMHLERDQLVAETFRPVPQAQLGNRVLLGLWALRVFVVVVSAMVIYTFVVRLG